MIRLPVAAFAALVVATVGAFFVTQHLKVSNPLINGSPRPDPPAINPISGRACRDLAGKRVSFKRTELSFYLQSRSDKVSVYMLNSGDQTVSTVAQGRYMRAGANHRSTFTWNGHSGNGAGPVVPDGTYYFEIALQSQDRPIILTDNPVQVLTTAPQPAVTRVARAGAAAGAGPAIITSGQSVTIHFAARPYKSTRIDIYRTDLPGKPRLLFSFGTKGKTGRATWNGRIHGQPAPAGTYLVGMSVLDQACNPGSFPVVLPPAAGSTAHAGLTVRYLAASPPLTPVPAGTDASVLVDARGRAYTWKLYRFGSPRVLAQGREAAGRYVLHVRLPRDHAAIYGVALQSDGHHMVVPVVASATGHAAFTHVLLVLPALSWQGANPVDDTGDGLPSTLSAGDRISLNRPLADGLPRGLSAEEALISYLARSHRYYQLTTDVGLADGVGPRLTGHTGVLLDGSLAWLPSNLTSALSGYARSGGSVLSVGVDSMQSEAPLHGSAGSQTAGPPDGLSEDPFGAHHGSVTSIRGSLITVLSDRLRIFGSTVALPGFDTGQAINPPAGTAGSAVSVAGVAAGQSNITGFQDGRGKVVEIGLPGFATSLAHNVDAQELMARLWKLLSR
ncbi:MAG TPA: FlgD immunoglobulin-like domain containing protein [Solirubrobacteraceae bacterium]|nr:FlgD immunoglobulin-like domain containing protein [Solirubrobacteraceae bacterium]